MRYDGIAAIREILKIDPRSELIGLLLVRELGRAEHAAEADVLQDDAEAIRRDFADLTAVVAQLLATPHLDRPWLAYLASAHLAARRGELITTSMWLALARGARPGNRGLEAQASASLAVALLASWQLDPGHEAALGQAVAGLSRESQDHAWYEIRQRLARSYLAAGRFVDAELLQPGSVWAEDASTRAPIQHWQDAAFIRAVIARSTPDAKATDLERFISATDHAPEKLAYELAVRGALDGDFAAAAKAFAASPRLSSRLAVDPFVTHIKDCRQCDELRYARAPWTHASVFARLAQLAKLAAGTGEPAAAAAIEIGNALYNFAEWGNARGVLHETHQDSSNTAPALPWYQRAYELTRNKERKAMAAYLAAKAEHGSQAPTATDDDSPPRAYVWFPRLKQLSDTRYYKQVLRECSTFRDWSLP
ncbi:MAG TPA: hypothetical protein VGC42_14030 [Kofleriaceae bacterium]